MQNAAAETIRGWSGKISNFFEVALAAPTPDLDFGSEAPEPPRKDSMSETTSSSAPLESLSEADEESFADVSEEDAAPRKQQPHYPPPSTGSMRSAKRASVFGSFSGFAGGQANGGNSWGTWSQKLKEAREGATTLLAKAEKGLESIVTIDEASAAERERRILGRQPRAPSYRVEGGLVLDEVEDGSLPQKIVLEDENERERNALRGLGSDWFRPPKLRSSPTPPPDALRLSPALAEGEHHNKRLSTGSTATLKSSGTVNGNKGDDDDNL
jgi:hypothetical protein